MATSKEVTSELSSPSSGIPTSEKTEKSNSDDNDFVILEPLSSLTDSGLSTPSIHEKQAFESLEKIPIDSSLGASTIHEQPYWDNSRFIDEQQKLESKRRYFGEGDDENFSEKSDETCGEKQHVEDVPVLSQENRLRAVDDDYKMTEWHEGLEGKSLPSGDMEVNQEEQESGISVDLLSQDRSKLSGLDTNMDEPKLTNKPEDSCDGENTRGHEKSEVEESGLVAKKRTDIEGNEQIVINDCKETGQAEGVSKIGPADFSGRVVVSAKECESANTEKDPSSISGANFHEKAKTNVNKGEQVDCETCPREGKKPDHDDTFQCDVTKSQEVSETPADHGKTKCSDYEHSGIVEDRMKERNGDETTCLKVRSGVTKNKKCEHNGDENLGFNNGAQYGIEEDCPSGGRQIDFQKVDEAGSSEGKTCTTNGSESGFDQRGQKRSGTLETGTTLRRRVVPAASEPLAHDIDRRKERNERVKTEAGGRCRLILAVILALLLVLIILHPQTYIVKHLRTTRSLHKPVVEINTGKHVSPSSSSWQLQGSCRGYNSTYTIVHCEWKQIHPKPNSPENTVLQDGSKVCHGSNSHEVDATLSELTVPRELGNYVFELRCTDNTENSDEKRVDIWVNELIPPVITVGDTNIVISTSEGTVRLEASCRAVQGKIVSDKWNFISGPKEIAPSRDGIVKIDTPGKYIYKYKCTDSYGGSASSVKVVVTAKPPYVLGIDLGTSTTCIVVIKEDGTTQDINIYDGEGDTDSCMPSIVAFGLDGKLLIGEKALRQAVLNPQSTIYEVKRLMGRSYYDDPNHVFSYRVRPTLKSHSLKGVRAAIEIPCNGAKKLLQPELVSALILRRVADHAEKYLKVKVKDVVISVPAQFDDSQRKATMDAGLIAGLNPIKIVNEPTVATFAARDVTKDWMDPTHGGDAETKKEQGTVWVVVADIGGGTTDYALMQIDSRNYYKVIATDGNKNLGGRDIDIQLAKKLTEVIQNEHPSLDLETSKFQQKLRIECENAKIVLSENEKYSLTVEYDDDRQGDTLPLEYLLKRGVFEDYISGILTEMVAPLDSLMTRSGGVSPDNIEELYLVGGTSNIPKLKRMLREYFSKVKRVRHKDPVQLVSRGAAAFGAALARLVEVEHMPKIDVTPLPISIAVDMDDMHVIFKRNHLYPCTTNRMVTTFTDDQTAIIVKVYEGDGRTADECHFLGEFELSGIPALPKGIPEIKTTFRIDTNGILNVKAMHGDKVTGMKLDVYSKSGSMMSKTREKLSLLLAQLMSGNSNRQPRCSLLDNASEMNLIPPKPNRKNVLKLSVDSQYESVEMANTQDPTADLVAVGMVAVKGLVTDYDSAAKESDLDIVLVIDESGSMQGLPIETIKHVLDRLVGFLKSNHRLGIVSYDNSVNVLLELAYCTEEYKQKARGVVRGITASGQTNLYGGLLRGLQIAYHGGRRSRVLLFTDGYANVGWSAADDIIREILKETTLLKSFTSSQVQLSTFGYLGAHDESLLQRLATNVGGGTYNYLRENSALAKGFGLVLGDAINIVAEKIHLTVTPLNGVQILNAITNFSYKGNSKKMSFDIPSTADQQRRHILLRLAVPSCEESRPHDALFHVELTYTNTMTERAEGSEEYLFVARTNRLEQETRSHEVDEQLNRVFVADMIGKALDYLKEDNTERAMEVLKEADRFVLNSVSKEHTLSLCLRHDLSLLISEVESGDLNDARKALQDSLTSHWQEKGGRSSCYLTKKEDKLISILQS